MEKTKAIAYRDFVLEAEKAFDRIFEQETDLTSTEIQKLKERYSLGQFEKHITDFENELRDNILKYDDISFIKAYLKSVFDASCRYVDKYSHIPEAIINRDNEIEFLLMLWKAMNETFDTFNYYCDRVDNSALYIPFYKYIEDFKKEIIVGNKEENTDTPLLFNPRFDFNNLKTELENTALTPSEKFNLVNDRLYDFLQWQKQYDAYDDFNITWGAPNESKYEITRKLYPNFEKLCKMEMERWKNVQFKIIPA